jgi:hypothetical protein
VVRKTRNHNVRQSSDGWTGVNPGFPAFQILGSPSEASFWPEPPSHRSCESSLKRLN